MWMVLLLRPMHDDVTAHSHSPPERLEVREITDDDSLSFC